MNPLLTTLRGGRDRIRRQREKILDRGLTLAGQTRDAGVDLLSRMELNADSWRRSLAARQELRRAELKGTAEGRSADLSKIELLLLRRVDRFLEEIALRVRAQIEKLGRLELSAEAEETEEALEVEAEVEVEAKVEAKAEKTEEAPKVEVAPKAVATEPAAKATKPAAKATKPAAKATKPAAKAKPKVEAPADEVEAKAEKTASAKKKKATKKDRPSARKQGTTRWTMPIGGYDELNVKQIGGELPNLTKSQLRTVREHEEARKNRVTVLRAIDRLLEA